MLMLPTLQPSPPPGSARRQLRGRAGRGGAEPVPLTGSTRAGPGPSSLSAAPTSHPPPAPACRDLEIETILRNPPTRSPECVTCGGRVCYHPVLQTVPLAWMPSTASESK
ncbi:uncharacterized protein LOC144578555 isoform X2 [Callithrix jacchus]